MTQPSGYFRSRKPQSRNPVLALSLPVTHICKMLQITGQAAVLPSEAATPVRRSKKKELAPIELLPQELLLKIAEYMSLSQLLLFSALDSHALKECTSVALQDLFAKIKRDANKGIGDGLYRDDCQVPSEPPALELPLEIAPKDSMMCLSFQEGSLDTEKGIQLVRQQSQTLTFLRADSVSTAILSEIAREPLSLLDQCHIMRLVDGPPVTISRALDRLVRSISNVRIFCLRIDSPSTTVHLDMFASTYLLQLTELTIATKGSIEPGNSVFRYLELLQIQQEREDGAKNSSFWSKVLKRRRVPHLDCLWHATRSSISAKGFIDSVTRLASEQDLYTVELCLLGDEARIDPTYLLKDPINAPKVLYWNRETIADPNPDNLEAERPLTADEQRKTLHPRWG